jgi:hypothetical protein
VNLTLPIGRRHIAAHPSGQSALHHRAAVKFNKVYPAPPAVVASISLGAAPDKRYSLGVCDTGGKWFQLHPVINQRGENFTVRKSVAILLV